MAFLCMILLGALPCLAMAEEAVVDPSGKSGEQSGMEPTVGRGTWENRWNISYGASNIHPGLMESEQLVEERMNGILGRIMPGYTRPVTFRTWEEDLKTWDFHVGFGRDINSRFSWFVNGTVSAGYIDNEKTYYPLFVPVDTHIRFNRTVAGVIFGADYYPFGKPKLPPKGPVHPAIRALRASRPFIKFAVSPVYVAGTGEAELRLAGRLGLIKEGVEQNHKLFYYTPRVGVEVPITPDDSLLLDTGYLFFTTHEEEYNGWSFYIAHRHKFRVGGKRSSEISGN